MDEKLALKKSIDELRPSKLGERKLEIDAVKAFFLSFRQTRINVALKIDQKHSANNTTLGWRIEIFQNPCKMGAVSLKESS